MSQETNQISSINSNQYYRNFINSCKSEATKNDYRRALSYFMDYLKIDQPKDDCYSKLIDGRDTKIIQADIIDWIVHMKDTLGLSPASINLYTAAVNHFYIMNDITLNIRRINAFKPEFRNVVEDQPYTREQIKQLLDKAEQRNRAVILLLSSSGMRVGALANLKIGDLTPIDKYHFSYLDNVLQVVFYARGCLGQIQLLSYRDLSFFQILVFLLFFPLNAKSQFFLLCDLNKYVNMVHKKFSFCISDSIRSTCLLFYLLIFRSNISRIWNDNLKVWASNIN